MVFVFFCYSTSEISNNKDNRDEEVPHIAGQLNNDLYAVPVKRKSQKSPEDVDCTSPDKERTDENDLPPGWEKHEGLLSCWY